MDLILILGAFLIVLIAQQWLNIVYSKYKSIDVESKMTGMDVAKKILSENDLDNIKIGKVSGNLSDHYNNSKKIINLSEDIYEEATIAAVSVAAHECGHALQYKEGYIPIKIRNILVPFVNFGNTLGYIVILISLAASATKLFLLGLILISFALIFQIITLPVEFDASRRARKILFDMGIVTEDEKRGASKMLRAAAFTYVAGLISSIMQILRLVFIFVNKDRD